MKDGNEDFATAMLEKHFKPIDGHSWYFEGMSKEAIALDANNANAFVGMAIAYLHSGRHPLARAALEEAKRNVSVTDCSGGTQPLTGDARSRASRLCCWGC
jgi:hypothetical protein